MLLQPNGDQPAPPITAQTILGDLIDDLAAQGIPLAGRVRGMFGRQCKELLGDGFEPQVIAVALRLALRRGEPQHAWWIAQDLAAAKAGRGKMTRKEYERTVQDFIETGGAP